MNTLQLQKNLIDACFDGDLRKAALFLKRGGEPNEPDKRGYYPLHMAGQEGHLDIIRLLLKNGAKLDLKDDDGKGESALLRAVGAGHLRVVKYLIKNGCNVNLRRKFAKDTALHLACAWGRYKEAVELVKAGARVNTLDDEKRPPIYYAAAYGHSKTVAFLLKNGASAGVGSAQRKILLDVAMANQDRKTLRVLNNIKAPK